MEDSQDVENYESIMQIVEETIVDPEKDTEEVAELVETTKERFKNLVSEEKIDEWAREYLSIFYWTMHNYHLNSNDIHARFEVLDQSEDHFEVSFLTLADEAGFDTGGTYHLHYVNQNDYWVFQEAEFFNAAEKPLNITFEDLEEYSAKFNEIHPELLANFEAIEELEVGGEKYLIFKEYDRYSARNTVDSEYNYEEAESYNEQH